MTGEREPLLRSPAEVAEDDYFEALYGTFESLDPPGMRDLLDGFDRPWWVVGGWAIEAFTRVRARARGHRRLDPGVRRAGPASARRRRLAALEHLGRRAAPAARPVAGRPAPREPDLGTPRPAVPVGVRHAADARPGRLWTNKRLPDHVAPVEEVTWVADDGIRYLNPGDRPALQVAQRSPHQGRPRPRLGPGRCSASRPAPGSARRWRCCRPTIPGSSRRLS